MKSLKENGIDKIEVKFYIIIFFNLQLYPNLSSYNHMIFRMPIQDISRVNYINIRIQI